MCSQIKRLLPEVREDEIWCEVKCSGKVHAHYLRSLLKIISIEIINSWCNFYQFLVKDKLTKPNKQ